jgi:Domain of unknown function (DUF5658)
MNFGQPVGNADCTNWPSFVIVGKYMSASDFGPRLIDQDMSAARRLPIGALFLFGVLSVIDLGLTWFLLSQSGGRIYEVNPIANAWLATYGWAGLIVYKVIGLLLVVGVVLFISRRQPHIGKRLLNFAILALGCVAMYSYYLLVNTP